MSFAVFVLLLPVRHGIVHDVKGIEMHSLSPFKKRNGISNGTTVNNVFTPFISHDLFKPDKNDTKPCFKQSSRPHK